MFRHLALLAAPEAQRHRKADDDSESRWLASHVLASEVTYVK
jgi:hypothetical protein